MLRQRPALDLQEVWQPGKVSPTRLTVASSSFAVSSVRDAAYIQPAVAALLRLGRVGAS